MASLADDPGMAKNQSTAGTHKSKILAQMPEVCRDERLAVEFLEAQRWGSQPMCPRCKSLEVYQMTDRASGKRSARWLWRCRAKPCGKQFTVRIGTVYEDSRIPLRHWCFAFWMACASKKGVSAKQISRMTAISYESALFMMHRVRWAMADLPGAPARLRGVVEADETYIGGKAKPGTTAWENKASVLALVERGGAARVLAFKRVTGATVRKALAANVDPLARIMTDESPLYTNTTRRYLGGHETVNHSRKEYARGDVHVNTAEGFFSLLKRGIIGTFHSVSHKHLNRYASEFAFRWSTRQVEDGQRIHFAIRKGEGKRLTYLDLVGKAKTA